MTLSNFIAGMLIGIATEAWILLVISSLLYGFIKCFYVYILMPNLNKYTMEAYAKRGYFFKHSTLFFYTKEYLTTVGTAIFIGSIFFVIKSFIG